MVLFPSATSAVVMAFGVTLLSRVVLVSADDLETIYNRQFNYIISTTTVNPNNIAG
jgi:hypothetical protein